MSAVITMLAALADPTRVRRVGKADWRLCVLVVRTARAVGIIILLLQQHHLWLPWC